MSMNVDFYYVKEDYTCPLACSLWSTNDPII